MNIHSDILERYISMIEKLGFVTPRPSETGTSFSHLLWMLYELKNGKVTGEKAHRWLGFIQGILIYSGATTVQIERDFTRPYFTQTEQSPTNPILA